MSSSITPTASFGFALLSQELAQKPNENVLISPVSVSVALAMTANGARGDTLAALVNGLRLTGPTDSFAAHNQSYGSLLNELKGTKLGVTLQLAQALWAAEGTDFDADFLSACWKEYKAAVNVEDFAAPDTLEHINQWCSDKTNGKITSILEEINPNNVMYLLNAVYFKGEWTEKFDKNDTEDGAFQTPDGSKQHPLMKRSGEILHSRSADYEAVALPFGTAKRIHLYVFLPAEGKTPADLAATFDEASWTAATQRFHESDGTLHLPRFKVEYSNQLNDSLKALGMEPAFKKTADFSGMGDLPGLHITDVQHKTFASFDEEGGEAAAVTSVGMGFESCMMPWELTVNRPFLAVLADPTTGAILFAGSIVNP
ncbi:MAG: serpin family protein [Candidatus Melainabacteria bacterium]|nr:serpin family protein [Candidatus Melainabacteria bacterium]